MAYVYKKLRASISSEKMTFREKRVARSLKRSVERELFKKNRASTLPLREKRQMEIGRSGFAAFSVGFGIPNHFSGISLFRAFFLIFFIINFGFILQNSESVFGLGWFLSILSSAPSIPLDWINFIPSSWFDIPLIGGILQGFSSALFATTALANTMVLIMYFVVNLVFVGVA